MSLGKWGILSCLLVLSFSLSAQFALVGDAVDLGDDCFRLTAAVANQSGAAWYPDLIDLSNDFTISADVNLGSIDFSGADGIAFVLQPVSTSLGSAGGGLGYLGINPSMAAEFDTYQNGSYGDPTSDHLALVSDGDPSHFGTTSLFPPVNILATSANAEDGNFHNVLINWTPAMTTLTIDVDCVNRITYTGDIVSTLFSGDPMVYFGFTAGTGALSNEQTVCFNFLDIALPPDTLSSCEGGTVDLVAPSGFSGYSWSPASGLDDPTSATPELTTSTSTLYTVTFADGCGELYTASTFVDVTTAPAVDLGPDTTLCNGASLDLSFPGAPDMVSWSTGATGTILTVDATGLYWGEATYGDCVVRDTIDVQAFNAVAEIGVDEVNLCLGDSVQLGPAAVPGLSYSWSDGQSSSMIWVNESVTLILMVSDGACSDEDTVEVNVAIPPFVSLPDSLPLCEGTPTLIEVTGHGEQFIWSTGETGTSIEVIQEGLYWVSSTLGACFEADSTFIFERDFCNCEPLFPTAFTPDGSGLNDIFRVLGLDACPDLIDTDLRIYNRFGEVVFHSLDEKIGWDGSYLGKAAEVGSYVFEFRYRIPGEGTVVQYGSITLLR